MKGLARIGLVALIGAASLPARTPVSADAIGFASSADIQTRVAAMEREMKPGQGFLWRPLLQGGGATSALEIWRKPGRPAVHPGEAEYATVVAGAGTLVSGGRLVDAVTTQPGLVEGARIDGGASRPLRPGDVFLVPAGVPHWFGITGEKLVLLGVKLPQK